MALEQVGVQLVADGADAYLASLTKTASAETALAHAAVAAVGGVNALDDQLAASARGAGQAAAGLDGATGATDALADATQDVNGRLRDASGRFVKAGNDAAALGDGADDGARGVKGLGDESEDSSKKVGLLDKITTGAAERIGHVLVDAAAQAGQAIVSFATEGVAKAGDFEAGMNSFAAVTGGALKDSGKSLDDFKDLFISLGRDLPVSTAEVQQAAIEMAKGGIDPATIAAGGLRTALDLAAASETGIAESAEILAKQLGVWVDAAADATTKSRFLGQAADLLSQAANASTVDVSDLALGLANTGKAADIAGLSFRETVTGMALISSGFSSAADAGTSFKTFIAALQPATDKQADAMKKLNLLTADGTSVFYDAQGSFIGLEQAAGILKTATEGLSEAEKEKNLRIIFGQDAIRAAAMLADAGADGYARMAEEMRKVGSVAQQAAAKQQGWNVAVDNLMGSLEALQLTVGLAVLPVLTKLVGVVASGVNAITDYAAATIKGETVLAKIAGTINDLFLPALIGAGVALTVYGVTQIPTASIALQGLIAKIMASSTAFLAQAVAIAAAAAPFVVLAAAVGGAVLIYKKLNDTVHAQSEELLNSRQWWLDAGDALASYGNQAGDAKTKLEPYAATITAIREQIQGEIEDLAKRSAAGLVSEEQYATEMAAINQHKDALVVATNAYNAQEQAIARATAAGMTATDEIPKVTSANAELGRQASLTAKDIEDLGKKLQDTYQKGQEAVQAYASTQSTYLAGIEERQAAHKEKITQLEAEKQQATTDEQRKGIDEKIAAENEAYATEEQNQASSYAAQQAAQQQHLGQMLIDYTVAQAQLGNISKEKAAEITGALEKEYGLQESSVASTFLHMAGSIDKFSKDSSGSVDDLIGTLRDQQNQAADTQKAMDDYAKDYTAKAVSNFLDAKGDAQQLIDTLNRLPSEKRIRVVTTYSSEGNSGGRRVGGAVGDDGGTDGARASGGPVDAMRPYLVGEHGPEIVVPEHAGTVIPAGPTRQALASPAQLGALMRGAGAGPSVTNHNQTINMPVYTNQGADVITQSAAIAWSLLG